jgi:hypothetical protein
MDSIDFDTFNSPAGGVELTDTFDTWRKKTNGIIEKIDDISNGDINLVDGSISDTKILDGAVTNTKIANEAVTNTKIANSSIGFNKLLDNAVGGDKIFDGGITASKLNGAQTGSAPIYGIRAHAAINGGSSSFFYTNNGFASVTTNSAGKYTLTLSETPTSRPTICVTAVNASLNTSAAVYNIVNDFKTFSIRTGFEDGESTTHNADFYVMVIY